VLILAGMILGIGVGYACHLAFPDPKTATAISGYISLITTVFLRLIKMIIAPLVFSTLVVGIAHMGDSAAVGRIGLKTMGWFRPWRRTGICWKPITAGSSVRPSPASG
jgi:Na+/H+-dicarboxylate symporter